MTIPKRAVVALNDVVQYLNNNGYYTLARAMAKYKFNDNPLVNFYELKFHMSVLDVRGGIIAMQMAESIRIYLPLPIE